MKEYINFEFSEFSLLGVIIIAVVLALLLKILNLTFIRKTSNQKIRNYHPLFMVIVWFSFILWSINILLQDSFYHMIAVLSLAAITLLGLAWFVSRDLFAGIVLRFSDNFYSGQNLSIDQKSGHITDIGILAITIQNEDGTVSKIPWSKINGQIYSKGSSDDVSDRQRFTIKVPQKYPMEILKPKIREAVFLSVGAALKKEPQIKLLGTSNNEWQLEITAFAVSPQYFGTIETNVKNALKNI